MNNESQEKINRLSQLEQSAHQFLNQRQMIQTQILEIESALKELETSDNSYKIIGNIMVKSNKKDLNKELNSKKEMLEIRVKSIEKQEKLIKEKASALQKEVMANME